MSKSGTLSFAANEQLKQIPVTIVNDPVEKSDEKFRIVLSNATGAVIGDNMGLGDDLGQRRPRT